MISDTNGMSLIYEINSRVQKHGWSTAGKKHINDFATKSVT
jgi:hypothetical protein